MNRFELDDLLTRWMAGELAEDEFTRLQSLLETDAASRQRLRQHAMLDDLLRDLSAAQPDELRPSTTMPVPAPPLAIGQDNPLTGAEESSLDFGLTGWQPSPTAKIVPHASNRSNLFSFNFDWLRESYRRKREFLSRPTPAVLSWASFGLLCILIVLGMWPFPERQSPSNTALATHTPTFVARLTALSEVKWADARMAPMGLSLLAEGQELELNSGLAEVTFHDGAKVVLDGPAQFVVQSRHEGALRHGQLTARMPPHALGLVIHTPAIEVVGLGTEFGIEVDSDRSADLEIFSGAVEFWPAWHANESTVRHRLAAGQAVHVEGSNGSITWVVPESDRYTRQMPLRSIEHTILGGPLVPGHFSTDRERDVLVVYTNAPVPTAGYIDSFAFYKQQATGSGRTFRAYVFRPTGGPNEYKVLYDSGPIDTTPFAGGEMHTISIGPVAVEPGDLIAHHGSGIPQVISVPGGVPFAYPVDPPPSPPATFTSKPFHKHDGRTFELRSYSFGAIFAPRTEQ